MFENYPKSITLSRTIKEQAYLMIRTTSLLSLLAVLWLAGGVRGDQAKKQALELGSPFTDCAILQRQMNTPVWGWARPGSTVTVTFADQSKTAKVDAHGRWMLRLDPLKASLEERELSVQSSDGETLTIKDVLVGEVWFSSGQSNMDWLAGKSMCRELAGQLARARDEVPVREFTADGGSALYPCSRVSSKEGWKRSKSAGNFSALSLAFAWSLYEQLKVPIGILRSTHGATPIETWTPYEGFASHPKLQDIARKIGTSDPTTPEGRRAYEKYFADLKQWQIDGEKRIVRMRDAGAMDCSLTWARYGDIYIPRPGTVLPRPSLPGICDEWKGASRMYNFKIEPLIPYAIRGMIWCQGTSNGGDGKIYAAKMEALVNGLRQNWGQGDFPFYFTQQQCYGNPDPDTVGFADLREAQTLFFRDNIDKKIGMVPQYELNSARPTGIHYYNKLDPGKRLARWALAHEYGRDIAYCGPIYSSHTIEGNKVRVRFEQRGPGGGLMVASKGMQADLKKDPSAYVEPARPTPDDKLKHFRLCGKDRTWHPAEAVIAGDHEVVVTSKQVPEPVGVQYAYSATPMGANLYNKAGLPATPFAYFDGRQIFQEETPEAIAKARAKEEARRNPPPPTPYLQVLSLLRNGAVIQRNQPVPVWGFAVAGTRITVTFGDQKKQVVVNEFDQWRIDLDPMPASAKGRTLTIACDSGPTSTIKDVVVGDVWILTGQRNLTGEMAYSPRDKNAQQPKAMPLVREFRLKTKARRFRVPRKRRLEVGGGKYVANWLPMTFEGENTPSMAGYRFAAAAAKPGVPVGVVTLGSDNPPITWVSHAAMQTAQGFEAERDELNLAYPNTPVCKDAVAQYIQTVKQYNRDIAAMRKAGKDLPAELASKVPAFPQPYYNEWQSYTETATHTYNFCISPITPFAVAGVVWIPGETNLGKNVSRYAAALGVYGNSLPETFGQKKVPFLYAQPTAKLVEGIGQPRIPHGHAVTFDAWPKSYGDIAARLGEKAAEATP